MRNFEPGIIPAYFGHHKCGSTWITKVVKGACRYLGYSHQHFHSPKIFDYHLDNKMTLDRYADQAGLDFVSYTSADMRYIGEVSRYLGFHVVRDPRDIVVSAYFSHKHSHATHHWPELEEFRKQLQAMPINEGLLANMEFTADLPIDGWRVGLFESMYNWDYSLDNIMEIKFEELIFNPYKIFAQVFDFLGLLYHTFPTPRIVNLHYLNKKLHSWGFPRRKYEKIPVANLLQLIYDNDFSRLAKGRVQGEENKKSHYRKGVPGDWKNHFTEEHKTYFKKNYNELLVKLGYEEGDKW